MTFPTPTFVFSDAVQEFWQTRSRQSLAQTERGITDQGTRSAVTGGAQMHGFIRTIITLLVNVGVRPAYIFTARSTLTPEQTQNSATVLPGFYRATKDWDLLVVAGGELVAALELKSQVGSFGNNFNNRTEEAVGTVADIWTA
ncbi:MAG: PaeR7I family type II restriction endonuclease, partial [Dehalococcoidia bacterium]